MNPGIENIRAIGSDKKIDLLSKRGTTLTGCLLAVITDRLIAGIEEGSF